MIEDVRVLKMESVSNAQFDGILMKIMFVSPLMIIAENGKKQAHALGVIQVIRFRMGNVSLYRMGNYQTLILIVPNGKIYNAKNAPKELILDQ